MTQVALETSFFVAKVNRALLAQGPYLAALDKQDLQHVVVSLFDLGLPQSFGLGSVLAKGKRALAVHLYKHAQTTQQMQPDKARCQPLIKLVNPVNRK